MGSCFDRKYKVYKTRLGSFPSTLEGSDPALLAQQGLYHTVEPSGLQDAYGDLLASTCTYIRCYACGYLSGEWLDHEPFISNVTHHFDGGKRMHKEDCRMYQAEKNAAEFCHQMQGTIGQTLGRLLKNAEYTDLVLLCDGESFKVHRMIVCERSPVIKAQCKSAFLEALTGKIEVQAPTASVATVQRMLDFLYYGEYWDPRYESSAAIEDTTAVNNAGPRDPGLQSDAPSGETDDDGEAGVPQDEQTDGPNSDIPATEWASISKSTEEDKARSDYVLLAHVHLYALADYYEIPELKEATSLKFAEAFNDDNIHLTLHVIKEVFEYTTKESPLRTNALLQAVQEHDLIIGDKDFYNGVMAMEDFHESWLPLLSDKLASCGVSGKSKPVPSKDPHQSWDYDC